LFDLLQERRAGSSYRNDPVGRADEPPAGEVEAEMQRRSPRDDQASEPLMRRLDRIAEEINPFLTILMVGLLILTAIRVVALGLSNLPITRVDPSCLISPASATNGVAEVRPPV
jgi:hypothetical protein